MLDPMSVLSVAASAVQFVDFSIKVVSKGRKLYYSPSGSLEENLQLKHSTKALIGRSRDVEKALTVDSLCPPLAISDAQVDLLELCHDCLKVGEKLMDRLTSLEIKEREKHPRWKSIRQALKSELGKGELNEMRDSLAVYKSDLMLFILLSVQENISLSNLRHADDARHIDENVRGVLDTILESHRALKTEICVKTGTLTSHIATEQKIIAESSKMVQEMNNQERSKDERDRWRNTYEVLLESLRFTEMDDRYETISETEMNTFQWIFNDAPNAACSWSSLPAWLRGDGNIYWVNGKAGSGKSTLMRYIYEHPKTRENLSPWASHSPLVLAGFFFWNSGVLQQRTQAGLLRTLLHQILFQRAELLPEVMPEQWKNTYEKPLWTGDEYLGVPGSWPVTQLQKSFELLVRRSIGIFNIGLFIDGLDEHDRDHKSLISFLENLALSDHIKILISSRPLVEFEKAFSDHPTLRLQDLTHRDIKIYVDTRLRKDKNFLNFYRKEPKGTLALVKEIVDSAEGVFLWVRLVVDSLLEGITYRDRLKDLNNRLRALLKIWRLVRSHLELNEKSNRQGVTQGRIYALLLSFAQEEDDDIISGPPKILSQTELSDRCDEILTGLKSRCAGLLEARSLASRAYSLGSKEHVKDPGESTDAWPDPPWVVSYIHRSARDFLEQDHIWTRITNPTAHTGFHPLHAWTRAWILYLKRIKPTSKIQKLYGTSLVRVAVEVAENDATPLSTWCSSLYGQEVESQITSVHKLEILKTIAFWLIDSETFHSQNFGFYFRFTIRSYKFSSHEFLERYRSSAYPRQAIDTQERRCIRCTRLIKVSPSKTTLLDTNITGDRAAPLNESSASENVGSSKAVVGEVLAHQRSTLRRVTSPHHRLPCNPGFICHFVLEDSSICFEVFSLAADIEAHFKSHLWEGKATPKSLEATETNKTTSPDFRELSPGFLVGGLD